MRKTKIICTIGPASDSEEVMRELFRAGMNTGRFNFSHGDYAQHERNIARFRKVRDELGVPAAVLLDTKGPEIRVRDFKDGKVMLRDGQPFTLTTREVMGDENRVSVTFDGFAKDLSPHNRVLIDDGKISLDVREVTDTDVICEVIHGGAVSNHKGINVPNVSISLPFMSEKDKADLLFGIENGVDYIAASFTRTAEDVREMRHFMDINGGKDIRILSKIESTQGVENFEEILKESDGIMIARGDMGVELSYEQLPGIQKRFIKRCEQSGKLVITATQMLESMIENPRPTRAETTDVANAVFDGTSAVMLSGETAAGKYPVEAVRAMARIAAQADRDLIQMKSRTPQWHEMDVKDTTNAVAHAACTLADDTQAQAIVAVTMSGFTARRTAKFRPDVQIIGATPNQKAYHQMALEWGIEPLLSLQKDRLLELIRHVAEVAIDRGIIHEGAMLVVTAGIPLGKSGDTNMIRIIQA